MFWNKKQRTDIVTNDIYSSKSENTVDYISKKNHIVTI